MKYTINLGDTLKIGRPKYSLDSRMDNSLRKFISPKAYSEYFYDKLERQIHDIGAKQLRQQIEITIFSK